MCLVILLRSFRKCSIKDRKDALRQTGTVDQVNEKTILHKATYKYMITFFIINLSSSYLPQQMSRPSFPRAKKSFACFYMYLVALLRSFRQVQLKGRKDALRQTGTVDEVNELK